MKIERVDEKTVKCFLSNEELEEYEIDYKDFVMRSEKAKQVVQEIIEQAAEQVGYHPPKLAFDMQIMMLPDQGMILTFSESDPVGNSNVQQILEYLREMKQILQNTRKQLENQGQTAAPKPEKAIFAFETLGQVIGLALSLPGNLRIKSELYEMDDLYYLYIQKGSASYERYSKICIQAMEFGRLYGADEMLLVPLKEHGSCLITERALQKLRAGKQA